MGTPFALNQRQVMADEATFLDADHDLREAIAEGVVRFKPKCDLLRKVHGMIMEALHANRLTPGEASKLRGTLGFLVRETWGNVARGGMSPLIQREFSDSPPWSWSRAIEASFEFHLAVLAMDAPRTMQVSGAVRPLVVVASDGAFEEATGASVSALFHTPQRRWGWCGRLTNWVMEYWQPAINPIMKIEFYARLGG